MIVLNINGKEFNLRNKITELTVGEFEIISAVLDNPINQVEKWKDIISFCSGIDKEEIGLWPAESFIKVLDEMFVINKNQSRAKEVRVGEKIFVARQDLNAKDLATIEKIFSINDEHKISKIIACFFMDEELSFSDNYKMESINYRAELIRTLPTTGLIPYLTESVMEFFKYLNVNSPLKLEV